MRPDRVSKSVARISATSLEVLYFKAESKVSINMEEASILALSWHCGGRDFRRSLHEYCMTELVRYY